MLRMAARIKKMPVREGGEVAEWSKALLSREKINEKPKRSQDRPLAWATF